MMGGKPEAEAMPRLSGRARRKTTNPERRSAAKFEEKPPGGVGEDDGFIEK